MWDGSTLVTCQMPVMKSTGRGREVNWTELNHQWDDLFFWADHVFLEKTWARPEEGGVSGFKTGMGYAGLWCLAVAKFLPVDRVAPQTWKHAYKLSAVKVAAVELASQLFPDNAHEFRGPRGGLRDGVAEAALIARYGYNLLTGEEHVF